MNYNRGMKLTCALIFLFAALFLLRETVHKRYFDFSTIPQNRKELRILLLHRKGVGEQESLARLQTACQNLGWECYIASSKLTFWEKLSLFRPLEKIYEKLQPDFTINFQSLDRVSPGVTFVSLSNLPPNLDIQKLDRFDGILATFGDLSALKACKPPIIRWYFTCPSRPFQPHEPSRIFYCGSNWDATRRGVEYKRLFSLLNQRNDFELYGPPNAWKEMAHSYRGFLPYDGKSLIRAIENCGIALLLHSESHIKNHSPTSRIFESSAAGCIILSDRHPFILKEFGDSILYIDQTQDPETIYAQIDAHLHWIRSNPEAAIQKAADAHRIFEERFTLEKQLVDLKRLFEEISHTPTLE
jgi:hypothetical protein